MQILNIQNFDFDSEKLGYINPKIQDLVLQLFITHNIFIF
jgi:hypothetical protein